MADQVIYAALGGILPAIVWLAFWLREDKKSPEPRRLIRKTFILGMLSVILVLPFQEGVERILPGMSVMALLLWAVFEEVFKFGAGYFGGLRSVEDNEPVDPIIYMITAALGFVALENTLFLLGPVMGDDIPRSIITGNLRFIGASLLHVVTSGFVGVALSFSFYKGAGARRSAAFWAILGATVFHLIFNLLIVKWGDGGTAIAFVAVWIGVIALLLAFEKSKTIAPEIAPENENKL